MLGMRLALKFRHKLVVGVVDRALELPLRFAHCVIGAHSVLVLCDNLAGSCFFDIE